MAKPIGRILTANDLARARGYSDQRDMLRHMTARGYDTPITNSTPTGGAVTAYIDYGRWIARCECGGAEAIDPADPIFYCLSCGNHVNAGHPRPVILPDDMAGIERELMRRPVSMGTGRNEYERATNARAVIVIEQGELSRSWTPGETVRELKEQNMAIRRGK